MDLYKEEKTDQKFFIAVGLNMKKILESCTAFWLGLVKIHCLAVDVTLRIDMTAADTSKAYAQYNNSNIEMSTPSML